jgi:hypothetical protein
MLEDDRTRSVGVDDCMEKLRLSISVSTLLVRD